MKKKFIVIPIVIFLAVAGLFVYNYEFHVLGKGQGNGTAQCTSYLRGNCLYNATFDPTTNDLTVYGLGQITGNTMYNVGFSYMPAVTRETGSGLQSGPIGANFQASSSLSNNVLSSGQTITITFDSINASAPANSNGQDGYIWIAYTTTNTGSDCVGPISSLSNCSFFDIGYINLNT
ncbi:MAG TPA: hypothetical protein VEJ36_03810 [Nitrososphaerales archaeon]|nr:hypothetical protein [Nitrososphaerales archaeon]